MESTARIVIDVPKDLPRELVSQFLASCRQDLARLQTALAAKDYNQARRLGHQLKGNGSPYGFADITLLGSAIEQAAAAGGATELARQTQLLETYLSLVEIA